MLESAEAIVQSALHRKESRGAHAREDYRNTNNEEWLKHTVYFLKKDSINTRKVDQNPIQITPFKPHKRIY